MQREPIQFGAVAASRARRSAAGFAQPARSRTAMEHLPAAGVLDEVFADFTGVDDASPLSEMPAASVPADWRATTRELIADISTQLATLDIQRRQLARLLETVETNAMA